MQTPSVKSRFFGLVRGKAKCGRNCKAALRQTASWGLIPKFDPVRVGYGEDDQLSY